MRVQRFAQHCVVIVAETQQPSRGHCVKDTVFINDVLIADIKQSGNFPVQSNLQVECIHTETPF